VNNWVKPYLIKELRDKISRFSKQPEEIKRKWIRLRSKDFKDQNVVFMHLIDSLQHEFGGGLGRDSQRFSESFGSVLADLPEDVFRDLCATKNVFFIFTPFQGAEVKILRSESGIKKDQTFRIVNFPYASIFMPHSALRGEVAHELAHVLLTHESVSRDLDKMEDEADRVASNWGFRNEINALRDYWKE